jgi:hypothetical protein
MWKLSLSLGSNRFFFNQFAEKGELFSSDYNFWKDVNCLFISSYTYLITEVKIIQYVCLVCVPRGLFTVWVIGWTIYIHTYVLGTTALCQPTECQPTKCQPTECHFFNIRPNVTRPNVTHPNVTYGRMSPTAECRCQMSPFTISNPS